MSEKEEVEQFEAAEEQEALAREARETRDARERLTAYKVWLSDLLKANANQQPTQQQNQQQGTLAVSIHSKKVARINLIASVIDKFVSDTYSFLTLDDGSTQIRLKTFGDDVAKLNNIETGDIILTIARLRTFNNELYLTPEIIKKVDGKNALLRRLELTLEYGKREAAISPAKTMREVQKPLFSEQTMEEREGKEERDST